MSRRDPFTNLNEYFAEVDRSDTDSARSETSSLTDFGWEDYWADDVRSLFEAVANFNAHTGMSILRRCSQADFFDFCYRHSSHRRPQTAG